MLIWWINTFSMIDYPDKTSCIVFTVSCNLRCPFCHNPEFVLPEKIQEIKNDLIPQKVFLNFLEKRKWLLQWVSICGWEPTLQKDLFDFCEKIKEMWFLIKLDTNWQDPKILNELIKNKLIDYIAMDIKYPFYKYNEMLWVKNLNIESYKKSINIIINSNINYEFRTTVIKWFHSIEIFEDTVKEIKWANNFFIQNYQSWKTLDNDFTWKSFTNKELQDLQKIAYKYINNVWIRN